MNNQWPSHQFRIRQLCMYNWGTFHGLHIIPIAEKGHLLIGNSGSGKSSLLDAMTALLIPPKWRYFNAAARKGDTGKNDRDYVSYVRGAWGARTNDSGEYQIQHLREGTTWSAIVLEFANNENKVISLIAMHWIRGVSNVEGDVVHHYMVAHRPFDIKTELEGFSKDTELRRLKQKLVDVKHFDKSFDAYCAYFRGQLGIENTIALKLLQKTAAAKDIGRDLNEFLRDFMLDVPETFDVADRLVNGFVELKSAHDEVVDARRQIEVLTPARSEYNSYLMTSQEILHLSSLEENVDGYRLKLEKSLLEEAIDVYRIQEKTLLSQETQQVQIYEDIRTQIQSLEDQYRDKGGKQIQDLEVKISESERKRDVTSKNREQVDTACRTLERKSPQTPQEFAAMRSEAQTLIDRRDESVRHLGDKIGELSAQISDKEKEFMLYRREIEQMKKKPSNIDADMQELRARIAESVNVPEEDLPFVGELLEVKKEHEEWKPAAERLLRSFALSILVDDTLYEKVSNYANRTNLGKKLVYNRTLPEDYGDVGRVIDERSIINKLNIKDSTFKPWLETALKRRFDYICARDMKEFRDRDTNYAITQAGQIKHGKTKHEKDDRPIVSDPTRWVLGFDNKDKRGLIEDKAYHAANEIATLQAERKKIQESMVAQQNRLMACQTVSNHQWEEIDIISILNSIASLKKTLSDLKNSSSSTLKGLENLINQHRGKFKEAEDFLVKIRVEIKSIADNVNELQRQYSIVQQTMATVTLTKEHEELLEKRFNSKGAGDINLKNLPILQNRVKIDITRELKALGEKKTESKASIEKHFQEFLMTWDGFKSDFKDTIDYADDFMRHLDKLERDDLPRVENHFFNLLHDQGAQNLTELIGYISNARKKIRDRMEEVNSVLESTVYNPGTYLEIQVKDLNLKQVQDFKDSIKQVVSHSWNASDRKSAEERFEVLRNIVMRLGSPDKADQLWKNWFLMFDSMLNLSGKSLIGKQNWKSRFTEEVQVDQEESEKN